MRAENTSAWQRAVFQSDRGGVTAEAAALLPAAVLLLGFVLAVLTLGAKQVAMTAAVAEIARLEARGDTVTAAQRESLLGEDVRLQRVTADGLLCVKAAARTGAGTFGLLQISARSCAAIQAGE